MQNSAMLTAAGVVGAVSLASVYFGAVMVKPRQEGTDLGEGEDISITSSGAFMKGHELEARPDYGAGKDYRGYMGYIPSHVLICAHPGPRLAGARIPPTAPPACADAAPIILAPTAHIIISMAQHSHALRKPLFVGAFIASFGAVAQRLYLMKDSWDGKEYGAEDEY